MKNDPTFLPISSQHRNSSTVSVLGVDPPPVGTPITVGAH